MSLGSTLSPAFSRGLDSSLVAYLASKAEVKVQLFHVVWKTSLKLKKQLNLPLQVDLFKDFDLENTLPQVVSLIEEADPIKASVGLPFYWVAQKAAEARFHVM